MKCDRNGCGEEAMQIAEGLDPARPVSCRCIDHAWTPEEMGQILSSTLRTKVMLETLTLDQRRFLADAPPADRQQILEAMVRDAPAM
jgi:hypothetical protein